MKLSDGVEAGRIIASTFIGTLMIRYMPCCRKGDEMDTCYFSTKECEGELWQCETCGEWFCQLHWHETSKGRNVECAGCEYNREMAESGEHLYSDKFVNGEWID